MAMVMSVAGIQGAPAGRRRGGATLAHFAAVGKRPLGGGRANRDRMSRVRVGMVSMKGRTRRGRVRPVGAGALQRKRRARPRLSRRALEPTATGEVVAAPDTLHADAEERIVIA